MKMHKLPLVSIIMPTYNQSQYITKSIESVINQAYKNIELIIINDGSTDNTKKIIEKYQKRFPEKIKVKNKKNEGAAKALNDGIAISSGEYIGWLSSDDIFLKNKISEQIKLFSDNNEYAAIYTDFYQINEHGKIINEIKCPYYDDKSFFIYKLFAGGNFINGSSVLIKKDILNKVGLFNTKLPVHVDGDMWSRVLKRYKFGHVPITLLKYRIHAKNQSSDIYLMHKHKKPRLKMMFKIYTIDEIMSPLKKDLDSYYYNVSLILLKKYLFIYSLQYFASSIFKNFLYKKNIYYPIFLIKYLLIYLYKLLLIYKYRLRKLTTNN